MTHIAPQLIAAVDLDRKAASILLQAAKIARLCQAQLLVVHAVDYADAAESDQLPATPLPEIRRAMAREARAWLRGVLHHHNLPEVEPTVLEGRPAATVAAFAWAQGARYLVTGSPRWGVLSDFAQLGADPRLRAIGCEVLNAGGNGERLGRVVSDWLVQWRPVVR